MRNIRDYPWKGNGPDYGWDPYFLRALHESTPPPELDRPGKGLLNQIAGTLEEQLARAAQGRRGQHHQARERFLADLPLEQLLLAHLAEILPHLEQSLLHRLGGIISEQIAKELPDAIDAYFEDDQEEDHG
jgi:hypothetical protein